MTCHSDKIEKERDYQRRYYLKNRDKLMERRRLRYQNDPEYRARNKASKLRNKGKSEGYVRRVMHNGSFVHVYSTGAVAKEISPRVRPEMISKLERDGKIPKPTVEGRKRLYTEAQKRIIVDNYNDLKAGDEDVINSVSEQWND